VTTTSGFFRFGILDGPSVRCDDRDWKDQHSPVQASLTETTDTAFIGYRAGRVADFSLSDGRARGQRPHVG
jgi:hypothetical protein